MRAVGLLILVMVLLAAAPARAVESGVVLGSRPSGQGADPFAAVNDLGVGWVRVFADWSVLEPGNDSYNTAYLRQFTDTVQKFSAQGRKVLVPVYNAPAWASGAGDRVTPPRDPATYAAFITELIELTDGEVDAWEIWNEPDDGLFWRGAPDPVGYTSLLQAAHQAVTRADAGAQVVIGGLTANNFRFVADLYAAGAKGSFDAIGVHLDTACLTTPPEEYYREPTGEIGRFSFTGYREVRHVTVANGDPKPVWVTELGWSTTPATCTRGTSAGKRPGGVSESQQAEYLKRAYHCLAQDDYVGPALWFSLQDISTSTNDAHRLGLIRDNGTRKPAFAAMRSVAREGDTLAGACGGRLDKTPPVVRLLRPLPGEQYYDRLPIRAIATDDQEVRKIEVFADGVKINALGRGGRFRLDWLGSSKLPFGTHTITARATDRARNVSSDVSVTVTRVNPALLPPFTARIAVRRGKLRPGYRMRVTGRLATRSIVPPKGTLLVELQRLEKGRYRTRHRFPRGASKRFAFIATLAGPGRWRIRTTFLPAVAPYLQTRARDLHFRIGR